MTIIIEQDGIIFLKKDYFLVTILYTYSGSGVPAADGNDENNPCVFRCCSDP